MSAGFRRFSAFCFLALAHAAGAAAPSDAPSASADRGALLFAKNCATCHGVVGRGDGPAAALLDPRARDFSTGRFRIAETANGIPSDEDLFRVITRGMPGSAMPPWGHLSEGDRRALAAQVRRLSVEGIASRLASGSPPLDRDAALRLAESKMTPGDPVVPPRSPVDTLEGLFEGRRLYVGNCLPCHGPAGRGDGTVDQRDESGYPTRPRDLTRGIFKGDDAPGEIWKRIRIGMPGSPMPAAVTLGDDAIWRLVQYVRSLVPPQAEGRFLQSRQEIVAVSIGKEPLPLDPDSRDWARAKPVYVALAPLAWRDDRPEGVLVEALHDGESIAFRLTWEDATRNDSARAGARGASASLSAPWSDAVAMQFALGEDEPLFAMGEESSPVTLWHWRAAWDRARPDSRALDPDAVSAPPHRAISVESATVAGFRAHAAERLPAGPVFGVGSHGNSEWGDPSWRVVLARSLASAGEKGSDVAFVPGGRRIPVGFAVWDGAAGDHLGRKSFSIWHDLVFEKP